MAKTFQAGSVTFACADPGKLSEFYRKATDAKILYSSNESVYLELPGGLRLGFDRTENSIAPDWESETTPRIRVDLGVKDLAAAERQLLQSGASRPGHRQDTKNWIFMADPEGNLFCLTSVY